MNAIAHSLSPHNRYKRKKKKKKKKRRGENEHKRTPREVRGIILIKYDSPPSDCYAY
jgi:hypothetical protein